MSPYGATPVKAAHKTLATTTWDESISVHHVNRQTAPPDLIKIIYEEFEKELEVGRTYPQEGPIGIHKFCDYFFHGDVFVGIILKDESKSIPLSVEAACAGRDWADCVAGAYYVRANISKNVCTNLRSIFFNDLQIKDNYPGRSSHICNGGFIVLSRWRGRKFGLALGRSYLHYAPLLGYRGSIFNLVYVNNLASVAIWERLGFERVGLIPMAGRLKVADGRTGEEYVDAAVYWKSFV